MLLLNLLNWKKPNHEEPGGAGGADNGKRPSAPRPKVMTAMDKEQALLDTLRSIDDRANELKQHDPKPPDYLTNVVRLHCVNPAFSVFIVRFLPRSVAMVARRRRSSIRFTVSFRTSTRTSKESSVL